MITTSSEQIAGKSIKKTLGLVKGNTIRARHVGRDIAARFRTVIGGEINEYTKMMAESREQAIDRMIAQAEELGADAIIMTRFSTSSMMQGAAEILVYGTAVTIEDKD